MSSGLSGRHSGYRRGFGKGSISRTHLFSPRGSSAGVVRVEWDVRLHQEQRFVDLLFVLDHKVCSLGYHRSGGCGDGGFRFGRRGVLFLHDVVVHQPLVDCSSGDHLDSEGSDLGEKLRTEVGFVEDDNMGYSSAEEGFHRDTSSFAARFQRGEVVEVEIVVSKHGRRVVDLLR